MAIKNRVHGNVTRGILARESGCNGETIRYYERIGLLPEPPRSAAGYRLYGDGDRRRLKFVLRARELGFALEDVRGLLGLVDGGYTCGAVRTLTLHHLDEIKSKIADLKRLERLLADTAAQCAGGRVPDCPIIDTLYGRD